MSEYLNLDCMDPERGLPSFPDNHFDLAIVDPPYGAFDKMIQGGATKKLTDEMSKWDYKPELYYFEEILRTSINQIIWGGNYFIHELPLSSRWLCWDKGKLNNFPEFELAWMSINKPSRVFRYHRVNAYINDMDNKIHPTQKPVALYRWLLNNYAKPGMRLLDTHVGSASSLIAFEEQGFEYVAFEKDADYYRDSTERIANWRKQGNLFTPQEIRETMIQKNLFEE